MSSVFLFVGLYGLIEGLLYLLNAVVWKKEAGENFLEYGIHYAQLRHDYYKHELGVAGLLIILGIFLVLVSLWFIKKEK